MGRLKIALLLLAGMILLAAWTHGRVTGQILMQGNGALLTDANGKLLTN